MEAARLAEEERIAREELEEANIRERTETIEALKKDIAREEEKMQRLTKEVLPALKAELGKKEKLRNEMDREIVELNCATGKAAELPNTRSDAGSASPQTSAIERKKEAGACMILDKLNHLLEASGDAISSTDKLDDETEMAFEELKVDLANICRTEPMANVVHEMVGAFLKSSEEDAGDEDDGGSELLGSVPLVSGPATTSASEYPVEVEDPSLNTVLMTKLINIINSGFYADTRKIYLERRLAAALEAADASTIAEIRANKLQGSSRIEKPRGKFTESMDGSTDKLSERERMLNNIELLEAEQQLWKKKLQEQTPKRTTASFVRTSTLVRKAKTKFANIARRSSSTY